MKKEEGVVKNGLISSLSLFLTKFLGIIYIIPLNILLATSLNRDYYSVGFKVYEVILSISIAGFPVAIATLVSRYEAQGNYAYARIAKKYGGYVLTGLGFVIMCLLFLFAFPVASMIKNPAPQEEIAVIANMIRILAVAIFVVANLGSLRGFYQGIKQIKVYSFSQFIEQVIRVSIIVFGGFFLIHILKFNRIAAVYLTAIAATLSAVCAYGLLWLDYRKNYAVKDFVNEEYAFLKKQIIVETIQIALPYILMAVLAYANVIVDLMLFSRVFDFAGFTLEARKQIFTAITMQGEKLTAIPFVVATGFSVAALPYLNAFVAKRQWQALSSNISKIISTVLYVGLPACLGIIFFTKPIFFMFFGNTVPEIGVPIVRMSAIMAILAIVVNISVSISMAIGIRKFILTTYIVFLLTKLSWYLPVIMVFGKYGTLISTMLGHVMQLALIWIIWFLKYRIQFKAIFKQLIGMMISSVGIITLGVIIHYLPIQYRGISGVLISLAIISVVGGASLIIYLVISSYFNLPQSLLGFDYKKILRKK